MSEEPEVKEWEVPATQAYCEYVEDDGFFRDAEIGLLRRIQS